MAAELLIISLAQFLCVKIKIYSANLFPIRYLDIPESLRWVRLSDYGTTNIGYNKGGKYGNSPI